MNIVRKLSERGMNKRRDGQFSSNQQSSGNNDKHTGNFRHDFLQDEYERLRRGYILLAC